MKNIITFIIIISHLSLFSQKKNYDIYFVFKTLKNRMYKSKNTKITEFNVIEYFKFQKIVRPIYSPLISEAGKLYVDRFTTVNNKVYLRFKHKQAKDSFLIKHRYNLRNLYFENYGCYYSKEDSLKLEKSTSMYFTKHKSFKKNYSFFFKDTLNIKYKLENYKKNIITYDDFENYNYRDLLKIIKNAEKIFIIDLDESNNEYFLVKEVSYYRIDVF